MEGALLLFVRLPVLYVSAASAVQGTDTLLFGLVPLVGIAGLVVGSIEGIRKRHRRLLWFAVSPALSQLLVLAAGLFWGQVESDVAGWIFWGFLAVQALFVGYLTSQFKGMRLAAASLSVFGLSYAFFAGFFSAMAFADQWL